MVVTCDNRQAWKSWKCQLGLVTGRSKWDDDAIWCDFSLWFQFVIFRTYFLWNQCHKRCSNLSFEYPANGKSLGQWDLVHYKLDKITSHKKGMIIYVALPWPEILPFRWGAVLWWSSGDIHMIMDCSPLSPDTPIWFAESRVVGKYPVGSEMGLGGETMAISCDWSSFAFLIEVPIFPWWIVSWNDQQSFSWVWLVGWRWLKLKWDGRWTKKITRQWILSMGNMLWFLKFSKILLYLKLSEFVCVQNLFIKRVNPCRYGRYGCFICLQRSPGFDLTRGLHLLLACYIIIVDPAGLWSISANSNSFRHLDWWWAI